MQISKLEIDKILLGEAPTTFTIWRDTDKKDWVDNKKEIILLGNDSLWKLTIIREYKKNKNGSVELLYSHDKENINEKFINLTKVEEKVIRDSTDPRIKILVYV